ncbi:hypothetical protein E2C01_053093 [Portunus trituberculatus]|uniref:Uncharacterized protein n=1 Tax=Portunus trituberculatus TaxID=210409 RepID=A0A5B7GPW2_PORTR|nr:hypothetical protein [Portunus trituberculatus]
MGDCNFKEHLSGVSSITEQIRSKIFFAIASNSESLGRPNSFRCTSRLPAALGIPQRRRTR